MFRWLWQKMFGPKAPAHSADLFDPEEVMIYTHLCGVGPGGEKRYARKDPLRLWHRVMERHQEVASHLAVARSPSKAAGERYVQLIKVLREVFEIPPMEEGGLSDPLLLQLYGHFMDYTGTLKKNTPPTTTSAAATSLGSPGTSENSGGGSSPTPTTSGSPSTGAAPSTDSPTPSASA